MGQLQQTGQWLPSDEPHLLMEIRVLLTVENGHICSELSNHKGVTEGVCIVLARFNHAKA